MKEHAVWGLWEGYSPWYRLEEFSAGFEGKAGAFSPNWGLAAGPPSICLSILDISV